MKILKIKLLLKGPPDRAPMLISTKYFSPRKENLFNMDNNSNASVLCISSYVNVCTRIK